MHKFFNATKTNDNLTLSIYGPIGADMFGDGISAKSVSDALAEDSKSITVRLNSPGGSAYDGVTIYNLLKGCSRPVNVIVDGMAASAASIVAMAGTSVTMSLGSVLMIHNGMSMCYGDANDMRKQADTLDTVTSGIQDIYIAKAGLKRSEVAEMMDAETWMTADEAVEKGFATAVAKDKKAVKNSFDLGKFKFKNSAPAFHLEAKTREVDGENLTYNDYVYAGNPDDPSTWSLPYKFSTDEKTKSHLRDALARFDQDETIPASHKDEVYAKLIRLCKEYGIKVDSRGNPKNQITNKGKKKDAAADDQDDCQCDCPQCNDDDAGCNLCSNESCSDDVCDCSNQDDDAPSNSAPAFDLISLLQRQLELNKRR